ncbi:hypothetical protein KSP40_PGU013453 [Platanthera guangdongensis]|uniref:Pentatricopeptide repeat-containing protein n=1 Tax=Platanthera guangdongensis TaxID=2320717 RepID=A0ABR2LPU5_9ASPA
MRSSVVPKPRIFPSSSSSSCRRLFSSSPSSPAIDTLNATVRPFPDYRPKKPSISDAEFVNRITTALKQRRSHHLDRILIPFAPDIRSDHLLWSLSQLRSHPALALSFIQWFRRRRSRFVSGEIQAIAAHLALVSSRFDAARQIIRQGIAFHRNFIEQVVLTYRHWSSDPSVFDLLFRAAAELGKFDEALSFFHRLGSFGVVISVDSCNALLSRLPVEAALNAFLEFSPHGVRWNTASYNIVIRGLCRAGKLGEAHRFMLKMDSDGGVLPDCITYSTIIDGYCRAGELQCAYNLLDEMRSVGLKPNEFTFNSIMAHQCKNGMASDAERVFLEMKNDAAAVPDSPVYTTMIGGFSKNFNLSDVLRVVDEMKGKGLDPDSATYTALICSLCRARRITDAEMLFQEMLRKGLTADAISYTALIDGYCKNGRIQEAFQAHNKMLRVGLVPNIVTYTALADGLCKHGELEAANELLHEICRKGFVLNLWTYNSLINGLCKSGNIEQAMKTLQDMEEAGLSPDAYTYTTLMDAYCKLGKLPRAHSLLREMLDKGIQPTIVTFNVLMNEFCAAGKLEDAQKLLEWMLKKKMMPNCSTYNCLLKQYSMKKNMKAVWEIYRGMRERDVFPDERTYNILVTGHSKARNLKEACYFHKEMRAKGFCLTAASYSALIEAVYKKKGFVEARKLFQEMRDAGHVADKKIYDLFIDLNYSEGNIELTLELCDEAIENFLVGSSVEFEQHNEREKYTLNKFMESISNV